MGSGLGVRATFFHWHQWSADSARIFRLASRLIETEIECKKVDLTSKTVSQKMLLTPARSRTRVPPEFGGTRPAERRQAFVRAESREATQRLAHLRRSPRVESVVVVRPLRICSHDFVSSEAHRSPERAARQGHFARCGEARVNYLHSET